MPTNAPSCILNMVVYSSSGSVWLCLPRTYEGPVNVTYNDPPEISGEFSKNLITFSEAGRTRKCFLGNLTQWEDGVGGEVTVEAARGKIYLQYEDEPDMVDSQDFMKDSGCCIA